jgi:hypothetical protein
MLIEGREVLRKVADYVVTKVNKEFVQHLGTQ